MACLVCSFSTTRKSRAGFICWAWTAKPRVVTSAKCPPKRPLSTRIMARRPWPFTVRPFPIIWCVWKFVMTWGAWLVVWNEEANQMTELVNGLISWLRWWTGQMSTVAEWSWQLITVAVFAPTAAAICWRRAKLPVFIARSANRSQGPLCPGSSMVNRYNLSSNKVHSL